jgi:hypothetical protein
LELDYFVVCSNRGYKMRFKGLFSVLFRGKKRLISGWISVLLPLACLATYVTLNPSIQPWNVPLPNSWTIRTINTEVE